MIACVFIPDFLLRSALRREGGKLEDFSKPLILLDLSRAPSRVIGVSVEGRSLGVKEGMPSKKAQAQCPEGIFLVHDPLQCERDQDRVLRVVEAFSPRLESAAPGLIYLDMGVFKGNGTESCEALRFQSEVFEKTGFRTCIGVTSNRFVSRVSA